MNVELILFAFFLIATVYMAAQLFISESHRNVTLDELMMDTNTGQLPVLGRLRIERQLQLLRLPLSPFQYAGALVCLAVLCALVLMECSRLSGATIFLISFAGVIAAALAIRELAARKINLFEEQLSNALDLIHAALEGGQPPQRAIAVAAQASKGAIARELREISTSLELGLSIERSLSRINDLYDSEAVRLFTQMLIAKWHTGGDFGHLVQSVGKIIRERVTLRSRIKSNLSGARYASVVIAVAPYAVVPFFLNKNPQWLDVLNNHPLGPQLLVGAIGLQVIGFFWLRAILRTQ